MTDETHSAVPARWRPGLPVRTQQDRVEWEKWRRDRKREQQRERRARHPRIDYYPAPEAQVVIDKLRRPYVGGDVSSVLDRIVVEWAQHRHRKPDGPLNREGAPLEIGGKG